MSKAMDGAKRKGREAAQAGKSRNSNPYDDKRGGYNNMVTFSRAFRKCWFEGFDEYVREQERHAASLKGRRRHQGKGRDHG